MKTVPKIKRILVVDDAPKNIESAKRYFQGLNIKVNYASSKDEAKECIDNSCKKSKRYDLVIVDINKKNSSFGKEVSEYALQHLVFPIVLEKQPKNSLEEKTKTMVFPSGEAIFGEINEKATWEKIFQSTTSYCENSINHALFFLKECEKLGLKTLEKGIVSSIMRKYNEIFQ